MYDKRIVDVACSLDVPLADKMIQGLLLGQNISLGIEGVVESLRKRYHSTLQRAIIACIEDAYRRFQEYEASLGEESPE